MIVSEIHILELFKDWKKGIKSDSSIPLYKKIYTAFRQAILNGELPNGSELPPTRKLSERLELSRSTIVKVYELLRLEGLLAAKVGSGHVVSYSIPNETLIFEDDADANPRLSKLGKSFTENTNLVNSIDDKFIAFRPGIPPLDIFPINKWRKQANKYWQYIKSSELSYYSEMGVEPLRNTIAAYLSLSRKIHCDPQQIFVVGGSLQSLFLIGSLLIDRGDEVLLENPTFPNVHSVFRGLQASISGIEVDQNGARLSAYENQSKKLKILHLTPSCHYPMGSKMSLERKQEAIALAHKTGAFIIENDYEHEINNPAHSDKSIYSLDQEKQTFYLSTFNRILHPSIRVGYMVVPKSLVKPMKALMRHSHLFVSPATQYMLNGFMQDNLLNKHVKKVEQINTLRNHMFKDRLASLQKTLAETVQFQIPSLHTTVQLKNGIPDHEVANKMYQKGIIGHALSKCYLGANKKQGIIFGHSSVRTQQMSQKIDVLIKTMKTFS
jgi:GntR family transcriptional regulator/MocR family aminotransferase